MRYHKTPKEEIRVEKDKLKITIKKEITDHMKRRFKSQLLDKVVQEITERERRKKETLKITIKKEITNHERKI